VCRGDQGIPPELVKGYQEQLVPDPAFAAAAATADKIEPPAVPKPKPKPRTAQAPRWLRRRSLGRRRRRGPTIRRRRRSQQRNPRRRWPNPAAAAAGAGGLAEPRGWRRRRPDLRRPTMSPSSHELHRRDRGPRQCRQEHAVQPAGRQAAGAGR
jgi:hypothetical protein